MRKHTSRTSFMRIDASGYIHEASAHDLARLKIEQPDIDIVSTSEGQLQLVDQLTAEQKLKQLLLRMGHTITTRNQS